MPGRSSRWRRAVKRAELERNDSETAIQSGRLDGGYQDLEAGIAAVELGHRDIEDLADKIAPADEAEPG